MSYIGPEAIDSGSRRYIAATMDAPFLERDEEFELARRWREGGDADAMQELVLAYARFVVRIAAGFRGYGLPMGDLVQEGNIGLMQGAMRFDPEREVRFSTYARWWIVASIQEYILRNSSIVRIGTTAAQKKLFFNLRRMRARIASNTVGPMTYDNRQSIADELGVPLAAVERMEAHISSPDQSLNATVGSDDSDEIQDFLADDAASPETIAIDRTDGRKRAGWIKKALRRLSPRERKIITSRFLTETPNTLAELGTVFGVSKERIRQIEVQALTKLRVSIAEITDDPRDLFAIS